MIGCASLVICYACAIIVEAPLLVAANALLQSPHLLRASDRHALIHRAAVPNINTAHVNEYVARAVSDGRLGVV